MEGESNDKSLDSINIRHLNFNNVKSVIFTKLESSTSKKRAQVMCKIDMGSDGNVMLFKLFKILVTK